MNLLDSFKKGGLPGLGVQIGANLRTGTAINSLSDESRAALFNQIASGAGRPAFGFTDKVLFTVAVIAIGIAAVRKAIK